MPRKTKNQNYLGALENRKSFWCPEKQKIKIIWVPSKIEKGFGALEKKSKQFLVPSKSKEIKTVWFPRKSKNKLIIVEPLILVDKKPLQMTQKNKVDTNPL